MRRALQIGLIGLLCLLLAGLFGYHWLQRTLVDAGIRDLEWHGIDYRQGAFHLARVQAVLVSEAGELQLELEDVQLALGWEAGPRVVLLDMQAMAVDWEDKPQHTAGEKGPPSPPVDEFLREPQDWIDASRSLPDVTRIHALRLQLPCRTARCELKGSVELINQPAAERVTAAVELATAGQPLQWQAVVSGHGESLQVESELQLDGRPGALFQARWRAGEQPPELTGRLEIPDLPDSDALLALIRPWLATEQLAFAQLPTGLQLDASWNLQPTQPLQRWGDWLGGDVLLEAQASLPQDWMIPDFGALSGQLSVQLQGANRQWLLEQGLARLRLAEPALPALAAVPEPLRPTALALRIEPDASIPLGWHEQVRLAFDIGAEGALTGSLSGQASVSPGQSWQARVEDGALSLQLARLEQAGLRLRDIDVQLPLQAQADAQGLQIELGAAARASAARVAHGESGTELSDVQLAVPGLSIAVPLANPARLTVRGQTRIAASEVQHAMLKPQAWTLQGLLVQGSDGLSWTGSVAAMGGLGLDVALAWPLDRPWRAEVKLQEVFFRAANPFADTLADWPQLLTLATGRLRGRFDLSGNSSLDRLSGRLDASGVGGIYDRTAFEGLDLPLELGLARQVISVKTEGLSLTAVDAGIPLGPLIASLAYQAPVESPVAGELTIRRAQVALLGGALRVEPTTVDLGEERQALVIDIEGLQLANLFEVYPAEGLSGRGTLDGTLPVSLVNGEFLIDSGTVRAREPGGVLQYRSERLTEMGRSNPGIRELAVALDDFRYKVLASELDYGADGVLILGLRLEGSNPDLQDGRPVHLNINLEENIPALLASLQLSGQVSDVIQKRVQERLLKQRLVQ